MRRIMTSMGLGLALTVGAAGAVVAQSSRPDTTRPERSDRREQGDRGMRRRGGPGGALLRGITLTDAQKTQLETLRKAQRDEMEKNRDQLRAAIKKAREASEKRDTATARSKMTALRTLMTQQRERGSREAHPFGAKVPQHGHECAHVERDVECEAGVRPSKDPGRQHEVRGTADGQKLRQALDQAQDHGLKHGQDERVESDAEGRRSSHRRLHASGRALRSG